MNCPSCSQPVSDTSNFCPNCGTPLKDSIERPVGEANQASERRQLTIMFCDLVGSTAMSELLDPEELRDLLAHYHRVCAEVVEEFDGYIAQYLGDGVLVYFGYPHAHENDASRAIHAGLSIVDRTTAVSQQPGFGDLPLRVRIGIHTGLVVTGEVGRDEKETLALGQAPNLAARVQSVAEPNTVAVSSTTKLLAGQDFEFNSIGAPALRGISQSVEIFRVLRAAASVTRLEHFAQESLTPSVGRENELEQLLASWRLVMEHRRQSVLIRGEAGMGKSRLISMFHRAIDSDQVNWLVARCSPYAENTAFAPISELIEHYFHLDGDSANRSRLLAKGLEPFQGGLADLVPVFSDLLDLPGNDAYPVVSPDQRKQQIVVAFSRLLVEIAKQQPTVLLVEDLHWADPSTLELLNQCLVDLPPSDVLALFTSRPSDATSWKPAFPGKVLELGRLPDIDVRTLIRVNAAPAILAEQVVNLIAEHTDGIPLFAEELTRMLLDSNQLELIDNQLTAPGALQDLAVPESLQSSLIARLDRLGAAKEVAQLCAVIGREFSREVLVRVSRLSPQQLDDRLDELLEAQILSRLREREQILYTFRHALIRDAAYDTLLKKDRATYHRQVALTLSENFPEIVETRPELIASHFSRAGERAEAIDHWERAGQRAMQRFANAEAIVHLESGIKENLELPDSADKRLREIRLRTALGGAVSILEGWHTRRAGSAFERALELCKELPETAEVFWVLWQLAAHYLSRDISKTYELGERLLRIANDAKQPELVVEARFCLGAVLFLTGRLAEARDMFSLAEALYDRTLDRNKVSPTGQNCAVNVMGYLGLIDLLMGKPDEGHERLRSSLALARRSGGPQQTAAALCWQGFANVIEGDWAQVLANAEEALPLSEGAFVARLWASMLQSWALAHRDGGDDAIRLMQETAQAYKSAGIRTQEPWVLTLLADGLLACGEHEACVDAAQAALRSAKEGGELFSTPEAVRILGEAQKASAMLTDSEESLLRAIQIARAQGAAILELKAVLAHSQLLVDRGDRAAAHGRLSEALAAFDNRDSFSHVIRARALLNELA